MAAKQPGTSAVNPSQEFVVRVPKDVKKKHSILRFHHNLKTDLTKSGPLKMERENNLRDYKLSYDMDAQPKFGAGSEFGREQRDEARRKKYGIYRKKYNPDDQPWLMKLGEGKTAKRFKGVKEGGISDNVSYFVFTQCADGAFEAYPIDEWYHFTPEIKYKCLTSEEAEEEFERRDKTLNFFSIMVKKRLKNEDEVEVDEELKDKKQKGKKSKKKDFLLTELDEWAVMSDGDVEDGSDMDEEGEGKPKKKEKKDKGKKPKKSMKRNSDDEALEESDSFDEGDEVDYMTDSESNDEDMYAEKKGDEEDKYKEGGVEDEEGLKKLVDSGDEDEEDEEKKAEDEDQEDTQDKGDKKDDSDSDSSASSESDSDPEKDVNFASALFMQKKSIDKKKAAEEKKNRSRSATPTEEKVKKRKAEAESPVHVPKKAKIEPTMSPSSSSASLSTEGISEEAVRRYLMRKPMTTKDLVQKFKNTGLSKEQLVNTIAKILKRIDPEKTKIKDKLYLSIKKPE